jgi:phage FluMu protein Com
MDYFETEAIEGERPFKCYVCSKMLVVDVEGEYTIKLQCPRCKTKITLESKKPLPVALVIKHGELTKL